MNCRSCRRPYIFVFGSNLAGRHGAGAAHHALRFHGAIYGIGEGAQGESYAIPTKDERLHVLSLEEIQVYVEFFLKYAEDHKGLTFDLTPIGTGLAGYRHEEIKPLFLLRPNNVLMPEVWS